MKQKDCNGNNLLHRAALDLNAFVFTLVIDNMMSTATEPKLEHISSFTANQVK